MTISDSIPIQFWLNGVETFNEKAVCGLAKQECFCQPFECDDEIVIQITDDEYDAYDLDVINEADETLVTLPFIEITSGVWQVSFNPSEASPAICERIKFEIKGLTGLLENSTFTTNILPWTSEAASPGNTWNSSGGNIAAVLISSGSTPSEFLEQTISEKPVGTYKLLITAYKSDNVDFSSLAIYLYNNGVLVQEITSFELTYALNQSTAPTIEVTFIADGVFDQIKAQGTFDSGSLHAIGVSTLQLYSFSAMLAKSDCIDLKESHLCTELIEYTNPTNFDDIDYETGSPSPTFYLRVPAMFHEEDNPQTQEDSELSNGVIVTRRQTIQEKTLLETGYMPNYMHKKLQKVLMHETIIIQDTQWKRRDAYEANPIKKYNLKRAEVLLTKYNSVERNTI